MITSTFDLGSVLANLEAAKRKPLKFAVEFIQDMNEAVVMATPYLTGNLRGSWYAGLNGQPDARQGPADAGGGVVARMNLVVGGLTLGDIYYAANGAAYGLRIEYGFEGADSLGRIFHQAPNPFVRGTLDRAPEIAAATAARIAAEP